MQLLLLVILLVTVLVSHNVINFEYFMPMSHGVNKKVPTTISPNPPSNRFSPACCFCSYLTDYCKNNSFTKQIFSTNLLLVSFDLDVLYMCFLGHFFSSAIKELRLASCLQICTDSHLFCLQIMWYSKRIHRHGLKIISRFFILLLHI